MLNCKQATSLVSQSLEHKLSLGQRLNLKLHLFICHLCRNYARQLRFMHLIAPAIDAHIEGQDEQQLTPAAKIRIQAEMKRRQE